MKVTIFELEEWERERFQELAGEHELTLASGPLTPKNAAQHADAEVVSTFIYSKFTSEMIEQFHNLKLIATRSTGFDHIPLDACRRWNVAVCNVPTYGSNTVAEHVFGLLLVIGHKLDQAIDRTRKGGLVDFPIGRSAGSADTLLTIVRSVAADKYVCRSYNERKRAESTLDFRSTTPCQTLRRVSSGQHGS